MCIMTSGPPSEELQAAAALLHGEQQGVKSAALLSRVLNNIISKPSEEKYRCDVVQHMRGHRVDGQPHALLDTHKFIGASHKQAYMAFLPQEAAAQQQKGAG
jgi:hypothetical protein